MLDMIMNFGKGLNFLASLLGTITLIVVFIETTTRTITWSIDKGRNKLVVAIITFLVLFISYQVGVTIYERRLIDVGGDYWLTIAEPLFTLGLTAFARWVSLEEDEGRARLKTVLYVLLIMIIVVFHHITF